MVSKLLSRLSASRAALVLLTAAIVAGTLIVHSILAEVCYSLQLLNLQMTAATAVSVGAKYLPADPQSAVRVADAYAQRGGVTQKEIAFTATSADNLTLTIRLRCEVPWYVALFATGLSAREINVTASARSRPIVHHFGTPIRFEPPGLCWHYPPRPCR
jgi:hypothetical protein